MTAPNYLELRQRYHSLSNLATVEAAKGDTPTYRALDQAARAAMLAMDAEYFATLERAKEAALDAMCRVIQDAVGQDDGGAAGCHFSGYHGDDFSDDVKEHAMHYFAYEISALEDDAG